MVCLYGGIGVEQLGRFLGYLNLGSTNMLLLKQELSVQVTNVNGVQVNLRKISKTIAIKFKGESTYHKFKKM